MPKRLRELDENIPKCESCNRPLYGRRPQTKTCSERCRKRLARSTTNQNPDKAPSNVAKTVTTTGPAKATWPMLVIETFQADERFADLVGPWIEKLIGPDRSGRDGTGQEGSGQEGIGTERNGEQRRGEEGIKPGVQYIRTR